MGIASLAMGRRRLMSGAVAALCLPGTIAAAAAPSAVLDDACFELWRKGSMIGVHNLSFAKRSGDIQVSSDVEIAVSFAMVTLYRYRQTSVDLWQEGKLVAADCDTNDNGTATSLQLRAANGRLEGQGAAGRVEFALGTMTDLCFWNPAVVKQRGLIDTQTGEFAKLAMQDGDRTEIQVDGRPIRTQHYTLAATKGRAGEVWYDEAGRLMQAVIRTRGEIIEYRRRA